jgi:hypothetical protein
MHLILTNHIGYNQTGRKKIVFQTLSRYTPELFLVVDSNDKVAYEGKFEPGGKIDEWQTGSGYPGDFSDLTEEGTYHVVVLIDNKQIKSNWFKVEQHILQKSCLPLLLEGFQSQHPEKKYEDWDAEISFFGNREDKADVHGGWYDASGDVSKYLSHLSYANFLNPQQTPLVVWSILESADKLKHTSFLPENFMEKFLKEASHGADFLVRMQDPEGYFYMTVFDTWSKDPRKREICAYKGQNGIRSSNYQAGFRQGGGMAIAALAKAGRSGNGSVYPEEVYIDKAKQGFFHLLEHNHEYIDDGMENIIDDYCALLAAIELFQCTNEGQFLEHSRSRSGRLVGRITSDVKYSGWWRADGEGKRPFFHASDAGLPLVALGKYLEIEREKKIRDEVISCIQSSVDFELHISGEVNNPFGYPRQYVKSVDERNPRPAFFVPHENESGYWWQGENARIASFASAMFMSIPHLRNDQKKEARRYAVNQLNWILGQNPYDTCMLDGIGFNNPEYLEPENVNYRGGICNGITSGFENESDIAFMPLTYNNNPLHQWRWSEQWMPHAAWFLLALSCYSKYD